jgi:ubiquinone/menaquinone biosynthesis C-methylase UbiE
MNDLQQQNEQRRYYAQTAGDYERLHHGDAEHTFALGVLTGLVPVLGIRSVLDIGAGTGRALAYFKRHAPDVSTVGIEPVAELREVGHRSGLTETELVDGDGTKLPYADGAFDVITAFGVLHHVPRPRVVLAEMLRVARVGVFVSDSNNFGQGSRAARLIKQGLNALGLWPLVNYIKTRGRGYTVSREDGLAYSYSVFTDYPYLRRACARVHVFTTGAAQGSDPYRGAAHVALLALKHAPAGNRA